MSQARRLSRIEAVLAAARPDAPAHQDDDEDGAEWWLRRWEAQGRRGDFRAAPDFEEALAGYRAAIEAAAATGEWDDPPPHFMASEADPRVRRKHWRESPRFENVQAAQWWVLQIAARVERGVPPTSQAEFRELRDWFERNEQALWQRCRLTGQLLHLDDGTRVSPSSLRADFDCDGRADWKGEAADVARRLRAQFGEVVEVTDTAPRHDREDQPAPRTAVGGRKPDDGAPASDLWPF
jgi:hypothetical protein